MTVVQKIQIYYLSTFASSKFKYLPKKTYLTIQSVVSKFKYLTKMSYIVVWSLLC
jgi:hypothetical protein